MMVQLEVGQKARIIDTAGIDQLVRRRLLDLGITEGSEICIKHKMPFGGPLMLESRGQCVAIRRKEALSIKVVAI
ncbi:FeoA family protein [Bacillus benzoevorans]|uniref:Ferrous iron transport protein A n=1 Tax=Bacillus benzoevorans TaxID=1456 RepID=A0A7X0LWI7_9BACI|nr:FeoA domain-containing protein [Bacillus benzoevorans]MBB6447101.1 ferrous iron transport protein A [Bacillus benzoevorans]